MQLGYWVRLLQAYWQLQMGTLTIAKIRAMEAAHGGPSAQLSTQEDSTEKAPAVIDATKVRALRKRTAWIHHAPSAAHRHSMSDHLLQHVSDAAGEQHSNSRACAQAEAHVGKPVPEPDSVLNGLPDSASEKSSEDSGQDQKLSPPSTPERRPLDTLAMAAPSPEKAAALLAGEQLLASAADADHEAAAEGSGVIPAAKTAVAAVDPIMAAEAGTACNGMGPAPSAVLPKLAPEVSVLASLSESKAPVPPQPDVPAEAQAVVAFIWVCAVLSGLLACYSHSCCCPGGNPD